MGFMVKERFNSRSKHDPDRARLRAAARAAEGADNSGPLVPKMNRDERAIDDRAFADLMDGLTTP